MIFYLQILMAIILDALVGDPRCYPHPVKGIGFLCSKSESLTRKITGNLYFAGFLTVVLVLSLTGSIVCTILFIAGYLSATLEAIAGVVLFYTTIAAKDLLRHSMEVYVQLKEHANLQNGRRAVAKIVGRDTNNLSEEGVCKAAIETVAENMVDGITAPFFFGLLASCFAPFIHISPMSCAVLGAFLYKAVNTMDSMIGYKNEKYLLFGRVAAKLDDIVNFIPARLSGLSVIIAAFLLKLDYRNSAKVFMKDRLEHASPNAGHTEAATAGALGVQLGGPSSYFDKVVEKPYLGEDLRTIVPKDIKTTNQLVIVGSMVFAFCLLALRAMFIILVSFS